MKKSVKLEIPYYDRDTKKERVKEVTIKRIFNWASEKHQEMTDEALKAQEKYNNIKELIKKTNDLFEKMPDNWKEIIKDLEEEIKKQTEEIKEYKRSGFFKERFNLIKGILEDNEVTDPDLLNYDFWHRKVEPDVLVTFLAKAVYKDIDIEAKTSKGGKPGK